MRWLVSFAVMALSDSPAISFFTKVTFFRNRNYVTNSHCFSFSSSTSNLFTKLLTLLSMAQHLGGMLSIPAALPSVIFAFAFIYSPISNSPVLYCRSSATGIISKFSSSTFGSSHKELFEIIVPVLNSFFQFFYLSCFHFPFVDYFPTFTMFCTLHSEFQLAKISLQPRPV